MGERVQAEGQQGQSEAQKTVAQKAGVALALERAGREIAGQQKEDAHDISLLVRTKQTENHSGGCAGGRQFVIEPTVRSFVRDRCVGRPWGPTFSRAKHGPQRWSGRPTRSKVQAFWTASFGAARPEPNRTDIMGPFVGEGSEVRFKVSPPNQTA